MNSKHSLHPCTNLSLYACTKHSYVLTLGIGYVHTFVAPVLLVSFDATLYKSASVQCRVIPHWNSDQTTFCMHVHVTEMHSQMNSS